MRVGARDGTAKNRRWRGWKAHPSSSSTNVSRRKESKPTLTEMKCRYLAASVIRSAIEWQRQMHSSLTFGEWVCCFWHYLWHSRPFLSFIISSRSPRGNRINRSESIRYSTRLSILSKVSRRDVSDKWWRDDRRDAANNSIESHRNVTQ